MGDAPKGARPQVFDRLSKKKPVSTTITFVLDDEAGVEIDTARDALAKAEANVDRAAFLNREPTRAERDAVSRAREELDAVMEAASNKIAEFTFTAASRKAFESCLKDHPPSEEQIEANRGKGESSGWNPETFGPALVALCCSRVRIGDAVSDGLTIDEAKALWSSDEWSTAELAEMFNAAFLVNQSRRVVDLKKAEAGLAVRRGA